MGKSAQTLFLRDVRRRADEWQLVWATGCSKVSLRQTIRQAGSSRWIFRNTLRNDSKRSFQFHLVDLFRVEGGKGGRVELGRHPEQVRVLEQNAYNAQVRSIGQILTGSDRRLSFERTRRSFVSRLVTVLYSPADSCGILFGFESFDRWHGIIRGGARRVVSARALPECDPSTGIHPEWHPQSPPLRSGQRLSRLAVQLPGADVPIEASEEVLLEDFAVEIGPDPFALLEDYADRVAKRYEVSDVPEPFANWCSWYPHRLKLTQEDAIETARVARARNLDKMGLRFIQVDLGWEKNNLPTYFEENERFSRGLAWLSGELRKLGFELGAWKGFACVAEGHPVQREHAEWLVRDESGSPADCGKWFWPPHAQIYALDITHPGAIEWVRENIHSLARRGVRYLKWDFGGIVTGHGKRHEPKVACTNATEGMRRIAGIIHEAMRDGESAGIIIDCTGVEAGGIGRLQVLYTNPDSGNTGIGFTHLRGIYECFAGHLFKNGRWGLLQPSCLVVGLPGTLEEARVRATARFLGAGHVDIGDNLTNLPEERWKVLLSTLPQNRIPARVIDLYHPIRISLGSYEGECRGKAGEENVSIEPQGGCVWHCSLETDWDSWDLVGLFNIARPVAESSGAILPVRFEIPFSLLGLDEDRQYWAYEFWSEQFLGQVPIPRWPAGMYRHPGDRQALVNDSRPGVLDVAFVGPAVKLIAIRRPRRHPWVVGTTFHQSNGLELEQVRWQKATGTLSGVLRRPPGQMGSVVVAGVPPNARLRARVVGKPTTPWRAANQCAVIPVSTAAFSTSWSLTVE